LRISLFEYIKLVVHIPVLTGLLISVFPHLYACLEQCLFAIRNYFQCLFVIFKSFCLLTTCVKCSWSRICKKQNYFKNVIKCFILCL
jgi:hypothetical protein